MARSSITIEKNDDSPPFSEGILKSGGSHAPVLSTSSSPCRCVDDGLHRLDRSVPIGFRPVCARECQRSGGSCNCDCGSNRYILHALGYAYAGWCRQCRKNRTLALCVPAEPCRRRDPHGQLRVSNHWGQYHCWFISALSGQCTMRG